MEAFMEEKLKGNHNFLMQNRSSVIMTGIKEVESFNDNEVFLLTELGELCVRGKNLNIGKVSVETGDLEMTGTVCAVFYGEGVEKRPRNLITKLFR